MFVQFHLRREEEDHRGLWFHLGANEFHGQFVDIGGMTTWHLGGTNGNLMHLIDVRMEEGFEIQRQIEYLDYAMGYVQGERARLGAIQNRLEFTHQNLTVSSENLNQANSRIRDADMALEMMRFTQSNVLNQAAISMLAQANQAPNAMLQLLR